MTVEIHWHVNKVIIIIIIIIVSVFNWVKLCAVCWQTRIQSHIKVRRDNFLRDKYVKSISVNKYLKWSLNIFLRARLWYNFLVSSKSCNFKVLKWEKNTFSSQNKAFDPTAYSHSSEQSGLYEAHRRLCIILSYDNQSRSLFVVGALPWKEFASCLHCFSSFWPKR